MWTSFLATGHVSISRRLVEGLDWAGRIGVVGALWGAGLGIGLKKRGYRKVRRSDRIPNISPIAALDFAGYWGLAGMVIGLVFGVVRG